MKKCPTFGIIPVTTLKKTIDNHFQHLTNAINHTLQRNCLPHKLKQSEVISVYKKFDPLEKESYRPVRRTIGPPHVSKVFERISDYKISIYVTGFRKSHGTQHSFVIMLERWKEAIDKGEYVSVMYMDLSKAFDTINHEFLLAKLRAYGFSTSG